MADRSRMLGADVERVVDGDTVKVRIYRPLSWLKTEETVRLLGIDAPESVAPGRPVERYGEEAAAFAEGRLAGRRVLLAFDSPSRARDRYGRLLAYVWAGETCFNAEAVVSGYAFAYVEYPCALLEEFRFLEAVAKAARRGMWR